MTSPNRAIRIVALLGVVGVLVAVHLFLREPDSTPLWEALFDFGHAPLYGVLSWVVLKLLDIIRPCWQRGRRYLEAFWIAFFAGAVMEILQRFGPREPQIADLLRNAAGIAAVLAVVASFDRELLPKRSHHRLTKTIALRVGAAGALSVALLPVILAGGALVARNRSFPHLCGFDTVWERQCVVVENAEIEFTRPPPAWRRDPRNFGGQVTFRPGRYSLVTLDNPYPDWTGYGSLRFTVYSEHEDAVTVTLWIADEQHVAGNRGSFQRPLRIEPGENRFDIPVSEIRKTDRERELDLTRIHKIALVASRIPGPFSLFLDDFRLG